jgi:hypothetical protein
MLLGSIGEPDQALVHSGLFQHRNSSALGAGQRSWRLYDEEDSNCIARGSDHCRVAGGDRE